MSTNRDCEPTKNPADQPKAPGDNCPEGSEYKPDVPELKLQKCPAPPECCKGKTNTDSAMTCLEELIDKQLTDIAAAEKAKAFKTVLDSLKKNATDAARQYTVDTRDKLLKRWQDQDRDINELVRKLVCAVPNWKCAIECYICPLLNEVHDAELWLYGDGGAYTEAHNLHDQRYWLERELAQKNRTLQRIKSVMDAWQSPAKTISTNLDSNAKLIAECNKSLGVEPARIIFDVFLRIVSMHLASAPPATDAETTTNIDKQYTQLCDCDKGEPNVCCGPDVGKLSLRERIIGPQPYLIDANAYYPLICCLLQKHLSPASDAVRIAEDALQKKINEIKRCEDKLAPFDKPGLFDPIGKAAIPSDVKNCECESEESDSSMSKR